MEEVSKSFKVAKKNKNELPSSIFEESGNDSDYSYKNSP